MTTEDRAGWDRVEPILDQALDLPASERAAFLDRACAGDAELRARLDRMLAAGEDPSSSLERSLGAMAGALIAEMDEPVAAARVGERIGPWKLTSELGRGGMGEVFLAERADGQFAQTAALKLVRRGREHDPLLLRRFVEERRILATLAHEHIARLLDGGVTPAGLPWFAMEYVKGRPLDAYCDDLALGVNARLALMEQVLGAVAYAHRNLLVHRDLKPGNIFVTDDGHVKLLDFGIAKLLGEEHADESGFTMAYGKVMTPEFAAPEQVREEPVTTATDIYALGAVLYQLLTGQRAHRFEKRTAAEIERVVCDTDPQAPSVAVRGTAAALPKGLSGDLDTIVLTALQKDPARRYRSADAMLEDLRRLRTGRPLLATPDSTRYRWGKFIGRHRVGVAAAAIVALVLAGGAVSTAWQARAARVEAARADRVKEFLIDVFQEADPDITLGKEMTARQLLDRGARRVDSILGNEPEVQAELYEVLGNSYAHLGLAAQADTLHRKGLAVVRRLHGTGDPAVLDEAMAVAWGLNDRGKYRESDSLLSAAIAEYRAADGESSQALSDALDILATAKKRLDQPARAESLYRQSLALQIRLTGPADTITASRLSDLAALLLGEDRLAPAESALVAAQGHRRGVLSPLDVKFLVGESNLAMIRMKQGALADAVPHMAAAVAGLEQIEHPGGLNLARALDRMALLQSLQMQSGMAVTTGTRAHTMFVSVMGSDHPETFNSASALAGYRADVGDLAAAEPEARAAYVGLTLKLGTAHERTLSAGQCLAVIQRARGKSGEAGALLPSLLTAVREKRARVPPAYAHLLAVDAGSDAGFRAALDALSGGTRVDSAAYPQIVLWYGEYLNAHGQHVRAASLLRQGVAFLPKGADDRAVIVGALQRELRAAARP
ncbi:MAG: protein kinase domain-containing protein [Gemmatimonadaceae bacterium]